jgi:MoaA/NifB/PqqE/SkfB family radical SAM enzyme
VQYDIEADWQLLNTCNYRCGYCFFSPETLGEKLHVYADPDTWNQAFDHTGLTWLLHITGGEPTSYPRFAELCEVLTRRHFLSFNSNLTRPAIVDFAKRVDPARVGFINAGLHAEERDQRKGLKIFLEHVSVLQEAGFPIFISIVCTPNVLERCDEIIALTSPVGLAPLPKLLRGPYQGKVYPGAYTAKERLAFVAFAAKARASYDNSPIGETPTVDVFGDERYIDGTPIFLGRMCSAGEKFVSLRPDGTVYRCESKASNHLGNLLEGSFRPAVAKSRCDSDYCFYFCLKYADKSQPSLTAYVRDTRLSRMVRRTSAWHAWRSTMGAR